MQPFISALVLQALAATTFAACTANGNNCARAITGTFRGQSIATSKLADCSAYPACTVTPAETFVYRTTTLTNPRSTGTPTDTPRSARTVCLRNSGAIPDYASACPDPTEYASACSCAGVTKQATTTATTPTRTLVVTSSGSPGNSDSVCGRNKQPSSIIVSNGRRFALCENVAVNYQGGLGVIYQEGRVTPQTCADLCKESDGCGAAYYSTLENQDNYCALVTRAFNPTPANGYDVLFLLSDA